MSRPARGGWIEIIFELLRSQLLESRPARGGWIEMTFSGIFGLYIGGSRPARGGWIEISNRNLSYYAAQVPPRTGRVD